MIWMRREGLGNQLQLLKKSEKNFLFKPLSLFYDYEALQESDSRQKAFSGFFFYLYVERLVAWTRLVNTLNTIQHRAMCLCRVGTYAQQVHEKNLDQNAMDSWAGERSIMARVCENRELGPKRIKRIRAANNRQCSAVSYRSFLLPWACLH